MKAVYEKAFRNNYMLIAIRDKSTSGGLLHTVRTTLESTGMTPIPSLSIRPRPDSITKESVGLELLEEISQRAGGRPKIVKRRHSQTTHGEPRPCVADKRTQSGAPKVIKARARITQLSDDDVEEPTSFENTRESPVAARLQQQTHVSPSSPSREPSRRGPVSKMEKTTNSYFKEEQAQRIHFIWKIDFEGMEHEVRRTLSVTNTFLGLLESFREEAEAIPSTNWQMRANVWTVRYRPADGTCKAVLIKPSCPHCELGFDGLLRSLAERDVWKEDPDAIVEIDLKAVSSETNN